MTARYSHKQLENFRTISNCKECVHFGACRLWMTILLINEERIGRGMSYLIPDIAQPCPMHINAWWTKKLNREPDAA